MLVIPVLVLVIIHVVIIVHGRAVVLVVLLFDVVRDLFNILFICCANSYFFLTISNLILNLVHGYYIIECKVVVHIYCIPTNPIVAFGDAISE